MNRRHTMVVFAAGAVSALALSLTFLLPGPAGATAGYGGSSTIVSRGTTAEDVHVRAEQPTDLVFARVTLQPGGYTGWHSHPGPLLVVVESGTLTRYDDDCEAQTYAAGQAFKEPAGPRHVHMGANKTGVPVVLDVIYIVPTGGPLRDEAPAPGCAVNL